MDFRKIANISVDCVVFGLGENGINILLKKRILHMYDDQYPVVNDWVLIGDQMLKSEKLDEAANRIFTNHTFLEGIFRKQFKTFGHPDRIKNKKDLIWLKSKGLQTRVVSVAYYFLLPQDSITLKNEHTQWFHIKSLPTLGFDHKKIIKRAYNNLKNKVKTDPLIFELLPDKFTLNELQFAYEALYNIEIDNRNFRKKALSKPYIVPLDEKKMIANAKKPAKLFMFSRDVYDKTNTDKNIVLAM